MKRALAIVAVVVVAGAAIAGVVVLARDDGPPAARVGSSSISQQDFDDELRVIGESESLRDAVAASQNPALANTDGSVTAKVGAGWLSLAVAQQLAADSVARHHLRVTAADRDRGRQLAVQSLAGKKIFSSLPRWFQDRIVERFTPVAALERRVTTDPPPALLQALASQCPSGRYVSHILLESQAEALTVKAQIDAGAKFADLARQRSTDTGSARNGGDLGCVDGQSFVEPFATVASTQPIGVVSDPVTTQFGSHLILVTDQPPESMIEQIAIQSVLGAGRGADVEIDPRYGTWDRASGQVVPPASATSPTPAPAG